MGHAVMIVLVSDRSRNPVATAERLLAPYDMSLEPPRPWREYETPSEVRSLAKYFKVSPNNLKEIAKRLREEDPEEPDVRVDPRKGLYYLHDENKKGVWDYYGFLEWDKRKRGWKPLDDPPTKLYRITDLPKLWTQPLKDLSAFLVTPTGTLHEGELWPDGETRAVRRWRQRLKTLLNRYSSCFIFPMEVHL